MTKKEDLASISFELARFHLDKFILQWAEIINQAETKNLKELCVLWNRLDEEYTVIDTSRKVLLAIFDKLNEQILPEAFENAGIDKIAIPELAHSFYPLTKYSASITKGENNAAMQWLKENGLGSLVTETVHRGTLAATLHDRLINEGKDPPDCMTLTKYQIISSSKYTPKGK